MVDQIDPGTCGANPRIQPTRGDDCGIGFSGGDEEVGDDGIA